MTRGDGMSAREEVGVSDNDKFEREVSMGGRASVGEVLTGEERLTKYIYTIKTQCCMYIYIL